LNAYRSELGRKSNLHITLHPPGQNRFGGTKNNHTFAVLSPTCSEIKISIGHIFGSIVKNNQKITIRSAMITASSGKNSRHIAALNGQKLSCRLFFAL